MESSTPAYARSVAPIFKGTPSLVSVTIHTPLNQKAAIQAARRLLLVERNRPDPPGAEIVRKYTITPRQSLRDPNVPKSSISLQEFWNGQIDPLLRAAIQARKE